MPATTYFDERAQDWDADPAKVDRARFVATAMRERLPLRPEMTALEFGCGTGLLSFALQRDFASITLADTSPGMLDVLAGKIAAAGTDNLHPHLLAPSYDALDGRRFDVVYSLMTLHHLADTAQSLARFNGLLERGGYLAITDLDSEDGSFHGAETTDVHRGFDRATLQRQAEVVGFADVRFADAFRIEKAVNGRSMSFPTFLMLAQRGAG